MARADPRRKVFLLRMVDCADASVSPCRPTRPTPGSGRRGALGTFSLAPALERLSVGAVARRNQRIVRWLDALGQTARQEQEFFLCSVAVGDDPVDRQHAESDDLAIVGPRLGRVVRGITW